MPLDELRVFISSTFRDLQAERAHLLNRIFPELRHRAREAGAEFTEIDLRWGLTDEDAEQGRVIRLCLEEVERCPFFIGILGDRYGWVPTIEDIRKDPRLLSKYPWLEQAVREGWSVTEYEMYLGALSGGDRVSRFYAKQPLSPEVVPLFEKIRTAGHKVATYSSPEELGSLIRAEWLELIDSACGSNGAHQHDSAHDAFARNRIRAYIPPSEQLQAITRTLNEGRSVILSAASGFGKSSLSSYLYLNGSTLFPGARVFAHFAGASLESVSVRSIISRMRTQFHEVPKISAIGREDDDSLSLNTLFESIEQPTILILDAVDQLQMVESELHWLPSELPRNLAILVTCTDEHYRDKLQHRREPHIELGPLSVESKKSIVQGYYQSYSKHLPESIEDSITRSAATSNPIYLRILLEELRLFGVHEQLESRAAHYLQAESVGELLKLVLSRLENDFSPDLVRIALGSLAILEGGLSEGELSQVVHAELKDTDRLPLTSLIHALEYHLMRRGGLLGFFHRHIEQAVGDRYLADEITKRTLAKEVTTLFQDRSHERSVRELAHLYDLIDDKDQLQVLLTDPDALPVLTSSSFELQAFKYWQKLESQSISVEAEYEKLVRSIFASARDKAISGQMGMHLINSGKLAAGIKLLDLAIKLATEHATEKLVLIELLRSHALGATMSGDLTKAIVSIEKAYKLLGMETEQIAPFVEYVYAHSLFELGRYTEAHPIALSAYKSFFMRFGQRDPRTIEALMGLANVLRELGDYVEAEKLQREVLRLRILMEGQHSVAAATAMNDLGTFLRRFTSNMDEAEQLLSKSLDIFTDVLGVLHPNRCTALGNLAALLRERGKLPEAKPLYEESVQLELRIHGPRHPKTATALHNYAHFLSSVGEQEEAEKRFAAVLQLRLEILGEFHAETIATMIMLGATQYRLKKYDEADLILSKAVVNLQNGIDTAHPRVGVAMNWLGRVKLAKGELQNARDCFEKALEIRLRDFGPDDAITADTELSLGKVFVNLADPLKARCHLELAYGCFLSKAGPDDPRTVEAFAALSALNESEEIDS